MYYANQLIEEVLKNYKSVTNITRTLTVDDVLINYDVIDDDSYMLFINTKAKDDFFRIFVKCNKIDVKYNTVEVLGMKLTMLANYSEGLDGSAYICDANVNERLFKIILGELKRASGTADSPVTKEYEVKLQNNGNDVNIISALGYELHYTTSID
jgi:hypothetical protein